MGRRMSGASRCTSSASTPRYARNQSAACRPAGTASTLSLQTSTTTVSPGSGTSTVSGSMPGAVSARAPLGSTSAEANANVGCCRWDSILRWVSTTIHRRSPASPHGSTTASPGPDPAMDLTG